MAVLTPWHAALSVPTVLARLRMGEAMWPILGVAISMLALGPLVTLAGASVADGYRVLFDASFGSAFGFGVLLTLSVPLILVGLGVALPYRAGLLNIGGEGQLVVGALVAVFVATRFHGISELPASFVLPLLAGCAGGATVAAIAGFLKAWRGINEIITTILLNFVAILFVQYWITGPLKGAGEFAASPPILPGFAIGHFGGAARIPLSIVLAVGAAVVVYGLVEYSRIGWRFRLLGVNERLYQRQGGSVAWGWFGALALGGTLAGLGGAAEAIGNQLRVGQNFSPGWGFDAIAIALLARGNMLAVVPFALFFAFLRNGSSVLQSQLGVPGFIVIILAGLPVLIVAAILGYRRYRQFQATEA